MAQLNQHNLLDLQTLTPDELTLILDTAKSFKEVSFRDVKKVPALRGKTIVTLFFEPSTRTRASFELAAKRLSADTINITGSTSSLTKGETIIDTAKNIQAMNVDAIVVRHSCAGVPKMLADNLKAHIVNAGDGCRAHPSQALLDMYTIRERKGGFKGLKVAIVGDILHSRVARSNIWGLTKMGAQVMLCGPSTLMPRGIEQLPGVSVSYDLQSVIKECDVLMLLRLQLERQKDAFLPSIREYARTFGVNMQKLKHAKKDLLIMHPGPTNRGVELSGEVADGPYSVILDQVANGVSIRMAILYLLLGKKSEVIDKKVKVV
ncbi:MAG: aspartate carbamoyltransferase catalytic subunit [Candidatus Omnitrophica bacterium]|nr:aspartate carbamoyltransferase catalytic subunit [Candidatus Omnitrophota bacterium]